MSNLKITDDEESIVAFENLLSNFQPDLVIVGTGRTLDDNYTICEILRRRNIKHIVPSAFPSVSHYKNIVVDGKNGPCYECLRGNTTVDYSKAVKMNKESREMFYTDMDEPTQPATIVETWPSAHSVLRLSVELLFPPALRSEWFLKCISSGQTCFVGGNITEELEEGGYAFGIPLPGQVVVYGVEDLIRVDEDEYICPTCARKYEVKERVESKLLL